jgi:hypothetical protein
MSNGHSAPWLPDRSRPKFFGALWRHRVAPLNLADQDEGRPGIIGRAVPFRAPPHRAGAEMYVLAGRERFARILDPGHRHAGCWLRDKPHATHALAEGPKVRSCQSRDWDADGARLINRLYSANVTMSRIWLTRRRCELRRLAIRRRFPGTVIAAGTVLQSMAVDAHHDIETGSRAIRSAL